MGQKKDVKLEDIARELGISIVSVSNALKGKKGVGDELRRRVLNKAEELGYQKTQVPAKKDTKSYNIGIIIAERYVKMYPSFYMDIYRQAAQEAARQGSLAVLEIVNAEKEKINDSVRLFSSIDIQGILIIGEMNPVFIRDVKEKNSVPVVCVDFYGEEKGMDYIVTDSFHGMQMVTQRLIDAGHRDMAFIGTPGATNSIMDRWLGYCKALKINHIPMRRDRLIFDRGEEGYDFVLDFELPEDLPTAFVCNCDKTAYILLDKLRQRGLRVPQDISVAGFDHSVPSSSEEPCLTTYESDEKVLAQISVNTLLKRMKGKGDAEGIRIVEGFVIDGDTVAQPKR